MHNLVNIRLLPIEVKFNTIGQIWRGSMPKYFAKFGSFSPILIARITHLLNARMPDHTWYWHYRDLIPANVGFSTDNVWVIVRGSFYRIL